MTEFVSCREALSRARMIRRDEDRSAAAVRSRGEKTGCASYWPEKKTESRLLDCAEDINLVIDVDLKLIVGVGCGVHRLFVRLRPTHLRPPSRLLEVFDKALHLPLVFGAELVCLPSE